MKQSGVNLFLRKLAAGMSLQQRFIVLVLVLNVPFCAYILASAAHQETIEIANAERETLDLARIVAARLDDHLLQMDSLIGLIGPRLSMNRADIAKNDEALRVVERDLPPFINNIAIWDISGNNLGSLDPSVRTNSFRVLDRTYFKEAIRRPGLIIEAPVVSRSNGELIAQFARSIADENGHVSAVVNASTRLRQLQDWVEPLSAMPKGTIISLLDQKGTILARSNDPETWIGKSIADTPTFTENLGLSEGTRHRVGIDGEDRISAFSSASRAPWRAFVGVPADLILGPAEAHYHQALLLGFLVLTLSTVAAWYVGRSVARPIQRLATDAQRFGQGDLAHRSDVSGSVELRQLSGAMNIMVDSLAERNIALARSERHLRGVTDNLPAIVAYFDLDIRFRFINAHSRRVFNDDPVNILGKTLREVRGEQVWADIEANVKRVLNGETLSFEGVAEILGKTTYYRADYTPDFDDAGAVIGFYTMTSDITFIKRAQFALAREKELLKFITDNAPALIAYVGVDERYQFVNQAYQEWFRQPLETITGQTLREFYGNGYAEFEPHIRTVLSGSRVAFERSIRTSVGPKSLQVTMVPDFAIDHTVQGFHILASDVSGIKDAQLQAAASEERLRTITDNLPALVCYIDRSHTFRFNNKTYERWQQKPLSEITDHRVEDVYGSTVYRDLAPSINEALSGQKTRFEVTFTSFDGSLHYARGEYIPDVDQDGSVKGIYGLVNDVTTLKRAEEKLVKLAEFDALTGLPNRNHFTERLQDALRAAEARGRQLAVLFLDLDKFKQINDSYGHLVGDAVLTEFGSRLRHAVRPSDLVARIGGDEFVVVIPEIFSSDEPLFVARKIINVLAPPIIVEDQVVAISSSIGVALRRPGEVQPSSLLKRADEALYAAKRAGRNTFKMIA